MCLNVIQPKWAFSDPSLLRNRLFFGTPLEVLLLPRKVPMTIDDPATQQSLMRRILTFPLSRIVLALAFVVLSVAVIQAALQFLPENHSLPIEVFSTCMTVLVSGLAYTAFVRSIERRPVGELSASSFIRDTALGLGLGALLFSITMGFLWLFGCYSVAGTNSWSVMVPMFSMAIGSGVVEEILFRAILFRISEETLGTWLAVSVTSAFFGVAHLFNPHASIQAALAIALEAGVMLSAAYVLTGRLWMSIGIHIAWNFVQGGIFGVAVSGNQAVGLLRGLLVGPAILTGGEFGVENSIVAVVVCLAAGVVLLRSSFKKGRFVQPPWNRSRKTVLEFRQ